MDIKLQSYIDELNKLNFKDMYNSDFLHTWDKKEDELKALFIIADCIRYMRSKNISTKVFDSGLGISIFRDNSTRTRFSFISACNLLGLNIADLDEKKSQIAHGETVKETATMISFMADVIGIRDDMYIGKGYTYQKNISKYVTEAHNEGVLQQKPMVISLQDDIDHPTQSCADILHLIHTFGSIENLKGKKIAMTWAYSPSYGKPLSVPQAIIGLMTRFGMNVSLAYPKGYEIMPEVVDIAKENAMKSDGCLTITNNMDEAFTDADIVYPKSWAPFIAMEKRTKLYEQGDMEGINKLEKELLQQNTQHMDWIVNDEKMNLTKNKQDTLYMHPLPADIEGVSCEHGEVTEKVFNYARPSLYQEASNKPYVIAAAIMLSKCKNIQEVIKKLYEKSTNRFFE